jgi:hypothetical protein
MVRQTFRPSTLAWALIVSGLPAVSGPWNVWGTELQTWFANEVRLPI